MSIADGSHPPSTQLIAFSLGRLDDAASVPVEEHLRDCPGCCALLADLPGEDPLLFRLQQSSKSGLLALASGMRPTCGAGSLAVADRTSAALPTLPGYEILRKLAVAHGVVYQARQSGADRVVRRR